MFSLEDHLDEQDKNFEYDQLFTDTVEQNERDLLKSYRALVDAIDTFREEQAFDIADLLLAILRDDNAKAKAEAMIEALAIKLTKKELGE